MIRFAKHAAGPEPLFETVVNDALKYIADNDGIDGIEYHIGKADGKIFKLVIEPDHQGSCNYGEITQDGLAYTLIFNQ